MTQKTKTQAKGVHEDQSKALVALEQENTELRKQLAEMTRQRNDMMVQHSPGGRPILVAKHLLRELDLEAANRRIEELGALVIVLDGNVRQLQDQLAEYAIEDEKA